MQKIKFHWTEQEDRTLLDGAKAYQQGLITPQEVYKALPKRSKDAIRSRIQYLTGYGLKGRPVVKKHWTATEEHALMTYATRETLAQLAKRFNCSVIAIKNKLKRLNTSITELRIGASYEDPEILARCNPRTLARVLRNNEPVRLWYRDHAPYTTLLSLPKTLLSRMVIEQRGLYNGKA
jgi:hypothetical protein